MNTYNNGLGELLGDSLATSKPIITPGFVWFVNSATGTNAASPAGRDREKPLATLAQAITNSANGDIILLEDGHTEILASFQSINKSLIIVGGGSSAGVPTVSFSVNNAGVQMFSLAATGVQLRNIRIKTNVVSNTTGRITIDATNCTLKGIYVDCGPNDQAAAVGLNGSSGGARLVNCTFVSTATLTATRPVSGLNIVTAGTSDLRLEGVVFDDGVVGFSGAACDLSAQIVTRIVGESISLLRGAEFLMNASSTGLINPTTTTGGGRIQW